MKKAAVARARAAVFRCSSDALAEASDLEIDARRAEDAVRGGGGEGEALHQPDSRMGQLGRRVKA
jgi:hypothetical protein